MEKISCALYVFLVLGMMAQSQEITQFQRSDFDLVGDVKSCEVITDYGKEIFEFDTLGRLISLVTQYNEKDRDVTTYSFVDDHLLEKRFESYKDDELDHSSSIGHFYSIDSTDNKIIREQIVSYDREFVEFQEYHFDENEILEKIIISHENAVDEVIIERSYDQGEKLATYFNNGVIEKSVRLANRTGALGDSTTLEITKLYLDGEPSSATERSIDDNGLLMSEKRFEYDNQEQEFVAVAIHSFEYDDSGIPLKETIIKGKSTSEKQFVFQFDDNKEKNWVKKIVTPDNTFITRRISYFELEEENEVKSEGR